MARTPFRTLPDQTQYPNLFCTPSGAELHLILLFITGGSLREHPVLGGQEVEHVKGTLPASGEQSRRVTAIPSEGMLPSHSLIWVSITKDYRAEERSTGDG